jgi:hypothetical protein
MFAQLLIQHSDKEEKLYFPNLMYNLKGEALWLNLVKTCDRIGYGDPNLVHKGKDLIPGGMIK